MQAYSGMAGATYTVGREVGRGGEGIVYEDANNRNLLLKIYTELPNKEKAAKLRCMTALKDAELLQYAAWPQDVVRDSAGNTCGFVMARFDAYVPLHMLFSPMDRKKIFPDKGYNFLVHVARNLATAFHKLHGLGVIAGDINEANILVNSRGMIALIDCDSFQVKQDDVYYYCDVGIPRYTAPELLERGTFAHTVRSVNTDGFSIATLIFQLLFLGRAPFTGINPAKGEYDEEKAIVQGEFAYSTTKQHKKLYPAKNSLDINSLTPGIVHLFHQAFETRSRPTTADWTRELDILKPQLINCKWDTIHYYPKQLATCPWCDFRNKAGIVYFISDAHLQAVPELADIDEFISGFRVEPIHPKTLSNDYRKAQLTARPIAEEFRAAKRTRNKFYVITGLLAVALFFVHWSLGLITLIIVPFVKGKFINTKALAIELASREGLFRSLKDRYEQEIKRYNDAAQLDLHSRILVQLTRAVEQLKDMPQDYDRQKKKVEERYYQVQYDAYLTRFEISDHKIQSFGPAKKLLLYSNGINTAADIKKLPNIKIPGIGPANMQILINWQRQMASAFTYIPDYNLMTGDFQQLASAMAVKKNKLEGEVRHHWKELQKLKLSINNYRDQMERDQAAMAATVYQAQLDWMAFQKFMR